MQNYFSYPYDRSEHLANDSVIATYLVTDSSDGNCLNAVANFAVGQTIGTWVEVPGISSKMVEAYQGKVVGLYRAGGDNAEFIVRLAFPQANFGVSFTMMMTALTGNDVSTALRTKLVDLEFGSGALGGYRGPRQGIKELRALTGVKDRPIVLNMIKPCAGFSPEDGARFFFDVAKGGVDLIKDDELLGSPDYNPVRRRTELYLAAAREAYEYSGVHTVYLPNISGAPRQMRENAKAVLDAGAKACLVNFIFGGIDALAELSEEFGGDLFIMAHYAGAGVMESAKGGIANPVLLGLLPRLAGAHAVMTMTPARGNAAALFDFYRTVQAQQLPLPGIAPLVATVGGGITPISQAWFQRELGKDVIIGIGGAIQGHPLGTTIGAQTAMAAVKASAQGIPLEIAAADHRGLQEALKLWQEKM